MDQEGGSLNVNAGPHNPFTVQEKPIQQPAYKQQQFSTPYPSNPKFNSKPSEMYKQKSQHMKKMDPTATVNVYSQPAPKPMGLSTTVSPYLPFGMSHYDDDQDGVQCRQQSLAILSNASKAESYFRSNGERTGVVRLRSVWIFL